MSIELKAVDLDKTPIELWAYTVDDFSITVNGYCYAGGVFTNITGWPVYSKKQRKKREYACGIVESCGAYAEGNRIFCKWVKIFIPEAGLKGSILQGRVNLLYIFDPDSLQEYFVYLAGNHDAAANQS